MTLGTHKDKEDPTRWIRISADYNFDFHKAGVGYFFTLSLVPSVPPIAHLKSGKSIPELTPLGKLIEKYLFEIPQRHPEVQIECYALMSDHLHVCFWIDKPIERTLVQMQTTMMRFCEQNARAEFQLETLWQRPGELFVCYNTEIYQQKKKYTLGNITRWHLDAEKRDYAHPHPITHTKLDTAYTWEGYGNEALLDAEKFLPCYITHVATDADVALFTRLANTLAQAGWILVGGFVSERERALLHSIRQHCQPQIIHLTATRLLDQKLPAQLASALYRQTTLRITSAEGQETCQRALCVWQNLWAERFCGDWRTRVMDYFKAQSSTPKQLQNLQAFLNHWKSPLPSKYHGTRPLP